ncbi:MAG: hypothetical protein ACQES9_12675 [Myxococcota bacterium]
MKKIIITVLLMVFIPAFASAECPKKSEKQLRIYKMKAIEKLVGYEFVEAKKLLDKASPFLKDCETNEQGLAVQQLIGIAEFSLKKYPEAKASFLKLFKLDLDSKLNEKLVSPKLKAFFEGIRNQYKNELKRKDETKAKIKKLESATGMPPEPEENPEVPLEHSPRKNGIRGRKFTVFCRVQDEMDVAKVQLFVKEEGDAYKPIDMKKIGKRRYVHTLSGKQTSSSELSYYIMAFNKKDKPVAASGNSANPHTVPLQIPVEKDSTEKEKDKKDTVIKESGDKKEDKKVQQVDTEEEENIKKIIDEPDEIKKARGKAKTISWDSGPAPLLFLSVSGGFGAGLVDDRSEVLKTELDSGFAPAKTMQIEAGYMYSRLSAFTLLVQMGFSSTDTDIMETQSNSQDFYFSDSMRNDYRIFLRYRRMMVPKKLTMFSSWRPFWGVGMGGGRLRHEVPAEKENSDNTVTEKKDTHFSSGTMLNAFGGAMLCMNSSCSFSLQAEIDYTATISVENSNYAHFDFLLGLNFIF